MGSSGTIYKCVWITSKLRKYSFCSHPCPLSPKRPSSEASLKVHEAFPSGEGAGWAVIADPPHFHCLLNWPLGSIINFSHLCSWLSPPRTVTANNGGKNVGFASWLSLIGIQFYSWAGWPRASESPSVKWDSGTWWRQWGLNRENNSWPGAQGASQLRASSSCEHLDTSRDLGNCAKEPNFWTHESCHCWIAAYNSYSVHSN